MSGRRISGTSRRFPDICGKKTIFPRKCRKIGQEPELSSLDWKFQTSLSQTSATTRKLSTSSRRWDRMFSNARADAALTPPARLVLPIVCFLAGGARGFAASLSSSSDQQAQQQELHGMDRVLTNVCASLFKEPPFLSVWDPLRTPPHTHPQTHRKKVAVPLPNRGGLFGRDVA